VRLFNPEWRVLRWGAALRTRARDPAMNVAAATVLSLAAIAWRLFLAFRDDPAKLYVLPFVAFALALFAGMFLTIGGIGWLAAQAIKLIIRWRAREDLREGMTRTQAAWVIAGVIFLGLPELTHAVGWWQENALAYLPGEEAALDRIGEIFKSHRDSFLGFALMSAMAASLFWKFFSDFRIWLQRSAAVMRTLLIHRDWRAPVFLVLAFAVSVALDVHSPGEVVDALLSIEAILLILWLLLPLIIPNLVWIVLAVACAAPGIVLKERIGAKSDLIFLAIMAAWSAWLFSILATSRMWRGPYWLGVMSFLTLLVW
jgi:hypothetical protein